MRVLLTRPQPGADRTAVRLAELGFEPVLLPLTEAVPLPQTLPENTPDLVVATSPQAFHHLSRELREALARVRVAVTGEGTAAAARDAGFTQVETSGGNVWGLSDTLSGMDLSGIRVLYLAGKMRRPDLENFLRDKAVQFDVCEVYDTLSVSYSTDKLEEIVDGGDLGCVLLTSVESVVALLEIDNGGVTQAYENAQFICLSERIAETVRSRFANRISVAAEPSENGLIQCLVEAFPQR